MGRLFCVLQLDLSQLDWLERQAQVGASVPRAMAFLKTKETEAELSKVETLVLHDQA